jgi:predicted esterase
VRSPYAGCLLCCLLTLWCCVRSTPIPLPLPPGASVRQLEVPTVPMEHEALAGLPGLRDDRVEVALALPADFDPAQVHPILITQVTADHYRPNIAELKEYAPTALQQGYVVLTAQGIPWPENPASDTLMHRYVTVRAALRWLAGEVPQSERWPIIVAGFSGGSKISQVLAISLTLEQRPVAGVFLGGCNEDHSRVLLTEYPAVRERFSQIAFFLSVGNDDRISPPGAVRSVAEHLRSSGARRVELSVYRGGHRLDVQDLSKALRWFRSQLALQPAPDVSKS